MSPLERALLAAHAAGAHDRLVDLYRQAADQSGCARREGFFLTQAYIFALETNHPAAPALHARLKATGREQ